MRSRYGPRRRLRKAAEFDAVFKRGSRLPGRLFLLVVAPSRARSDRLGLAVSRKVGGAVARNRARACCARAWRLPSPGLGVVVVAHKEIVSCTRPRWTVSLRTPPASGACRPPA
jgi:ribonuclease P protein component